MNPARLWPYLFAAAATLVLIGFRLNAVGPMGPFDEETHFDYVSRFAAEWALPAQGDQFGDTIMSEVACFGEAVYFPGVECGVAGQDPSMGPWNGVSSATSYQPTYYVITGLLTRLVHGLIGGYWISAARIASSLWLVLTAVLIVGVSRQLGAGRRVAAFAGAALCAMPMVLVQGTSVTNDVAAMAFTLLAVWAWLRLRDGAQLRRLAISGFVAVTAMTVKETAVVAVLAIAVLEAQRVGRAPGDPPGVLCRLPRRLTPVVAWGRRGSGCHLPCTTSPIMWIPGCEALLRSWKLARPQPSASTNPCPRRLPRLLGHRSTPSCSRSAHLQGSWFVTVGLVAAALVVGGVGAVVLARERSLSSAVGAASLSYLFAFPVAFILYLHLLGGVLYFQPRYVLPGMCLAVCVLAARTHERRGWVLLAGYFVYATFAARDLLG